MRKTWPSTSMWVPFLNWLVEIDILWSCPLRLDGYVRVSRIGGRQDEGYISASEQREAIQRRGIGAADSGGVDAPAFGERRRERLSLGRR